MPESNRKAKSKRQMRHTKGGLKQLVGGMSHTVSRRELVRQVPVQKQCSPPLYSLRDFVPQSPSEHIGIIF
jgi:hypothetical protein